MIVLRTSRELALLREAGRVAAGALQAVGAAVRPGVSTWELCQIALAHLKKQGAAPTFLGYNGFPAGICVSLNQEVIHGIPSKTRLVREGDLVSVDLGATLRGYVGDTAATFLAGQASPQAQALCAVTRQSLYEGIRAARPGGRLGDIGAAVSAWCEARGYSVVREYTGHGVGAALHEDPAVPNYGAAGRGLRLLPGMVLAIEPMVNLGGAGVRVLPDGWTVTTRDGGLSAHFEHTVAITPEGPKILTEP
jgi:methionyl aminopeptidase